MKNILLISVMLLSYLLQAQSPVRPLFFEDNNTIEGAYYKDLDNDFDNFTGTWKYINATDTLIIKIEKREQVYDYFLVNHYRDMLVGEYRYVKNGVEKVNTLHLLGSPSITDFYDHNISGSSIIRKIAIPVCEECEENERRVALHFKDPTRPGIKQGLSAIIILRSFNEGGVQKMRMLFRQTGSYMPPLGSDPNPPQEHFSFNLPWGVYFLTKID